jgi:hypothetical protein
VTIQLGLVFGNVFFAVRCSRPHRDLASGQRTPSRGLNNEASFENHTLSVSHRDKDGLAAITYIPVKIAAGALIPYLCTAIRAFLLVLEAFARGFVKLSTAG